MATREGGRRHAIDAASVWLVSILPALIAVSLAVGGAYWNARQDVCAIDGMLSSLPSTVCSADLPPVMAAVGRVLSEQCSTHQTLNNLRDGEQGNNCSAPWWTLRSLWPPPPGWIPLVGVLVLSLLPFAFTSSRLAYDAYVGKRKREGELGARPVVLKFFLASNIVWGWIYVMNPLGMDGTTTAFWAEEHLTLAPNTLPPLLDGSFKLNPITAGFVGWYLFFTAYMFYRARRRDVYGLYVYGVAYRKLLFTLAIGLALSVDKTSPTLTVAALLVGFVPSAALDTLRSYLGRDLGVKSGDALSDLLFLSPWDRMRLEEEGIDSLASLVAADHENLEMLPFPAPTVAQWRDQARLAVVVGPERYLKLRGVCMTAAEFIKHAEDAEFQQRLAKEAGISNAHEIKGLLEAKRAHE